MFDQHVRLFDQSADRLFVAAGSKTAVILENLERLGVAEEVAEELQLPDRLVRHAGIEIRRLHGLVDDRPMVADFKHAAYLAFVILTRIQSTFSSRIRQFLVRT